MRNPASPCGSCSSPCSQLTLRHGIVVLVLVMLTLAVVLSICSTVDAFVALSFVGSFAPPALLAFLVFSPMGPMIDLKSTLMFTAAFRRLKPGPWLLVLGTIWLLTPVAMLASSKVGKLRQRDAILDQVALHGDEHVLDVGTEHGLMAIGAAKRLRTGRAVGVDIWRQRDQADNTRDSALRNVESEGVINRCTIQDGDVRALPFPENSFDVVLAFFALYNVPGAEGKGQACREIARVLKPGGRVFDYDMIFTADRSCVGSPRRGSTSS